MISVVTAAGGQSWELGILQQLQTDPELRLCRRAVDVLDLLATAATQEVHVALVSLGVAGLDADTVYRLGQHQVHVIAVADADGHKWAAALGIETVIGPHELNGLGAFLAHLAIPATPDNVDNEGDVDGQIITVWGPAGAPGRSTVALNLAAEFAARHRRTLLIDADPYGGALAQMLGILDEVSGFLAAARAANSGMLGSVAEFAYGVDEHLSVLTGLPRAALWNQVRGGATERVLSQAATQVDVVVVDCGFSLEAADVYDDGAPQRNQLTLHALEGADQVVVVGAPDPVGLTRLARGVHELREALDRVDPLVVVNKNRPQMGWSNEQIAQTLSRLSDVTPIAFLPWEQGTVDHALMAGRSLREVLPDSPLTRAFGRLADQLQRGVSAASIAG